MPPLPTHTPNKPCTHPDLRVERDRKQAAGDAHRQHAAAEAQRVHHAMRAQRVQLHAPPGRRAVEAGGARVLAPRKPHPLQPAHMREGSWVTQRNNIMGQQGY